MMSVQPVCLKFFSLKQTVKCLQMALDAAVIDRTELETLKSQTVHETSEHVMQEVLRDLNIRIEKVKRKSASHTIRSYMNRK